jgi:hypothetical protein
MAAGLPFLSAFMPVAIGYFVLISLLALTAVFSSKPHRRKAALEVLRILVPGRRQGSDHHSRAIRRRTHEQTDQPGDRN